MDLTTAQIYRDLHHILLCGGLRRKARKIIQSLAGIYAVPCIGFGVHKDPTQHIRCSNDTQLRQLPFGCARTYPARLLKFNSLNERVISPQRSPDFIISKMPPLTDLLLGQNAFAVSTE